MEKPYYICKVNDKVYFNNVLLTFTVEWKYMYSVHIYVLFFNITHQIVSYYIRYVRIDDTPF